MSGLMKRCTTCERWWPVSMFPPNRHKPDGLQSYCRPCNRDRVAEWRRENPYRAAEISARSEAVRQRRERVRR